jgi:Xaa-Pro aminopeptidase
MLTNLVAAEFTPKADLDMRIAGLKAGMEAEGIAFAVILQNADFFYFSGTMQKGVMIVPLEGEPLLFIEKSVDRARIESPLNLIPIKKEKEIRNILAEKGALKGKGSMELDVIPVAVFERYKGLLGVESFTDISPIIKELRIVKSPFEIDQVKRSGEIVSRVFEKARHVVSEGVREIDIDADLVAEGRRYGHHGFLRMRGLNQEMMNLYVTTGVSATIHSAGDVPISGIGVSAAIPQGSSIKTVERGVPVNVDYGGGYNGYITDETRPFVAGELREEFRRPYEVAREIVEEAAQFGKEGVNATELFDKAYTRAKNAGLEEGFMGHGAGKVGFIGHGLGLEINELPVITPRHKRVLKEGMVFAFEPKFILPGKGAIGIEVDFIVRKDRFERVIDFPIDIVYV